MINLWWRCIDLYLLQTISKVQCDGQIAYIHTPGTVYYESAQEIKIVRNKDKRCTDLFLFAKDEPQVGKWVAQFDMTVGFDV